MPHPKIRPVGTENSVYKRMLLCAGPGFGKTVFFGTGGRKVLFLTTDKEGTLSARTMGSDSQEWPILKGTDMSEAYIYLRDGGIKADGIEWVVIDNVSEAQEQFKWDNIDREHKAKPQTIDEFVPTQGNYQRTQNQLIKMVKQFNDLPVNIAYTAWIATHEDSDGMEYFAPAIHGQQGAIAQMIAGYMNIVGYGEVVRDERDAEHRIIWFSHEGPNRGKDRYNALGRKRTDLTLPKLDDLINAKIAKLGKAPTGNRPSVSATAHPVRRRTTTTTTTKTKKA